ncbi:MAG: hypothetical protein G01um10148_542 [Parcubacteria group bacterium Gr01-1014_8]|nr:MAG: hypothetical protein G01um10148_542 [Parcubacteria group bacterium Gr01-1014_8]
MEDRPFVGIGVTILKDGKILLGKRVSTYGTGEYQTPGGHLEPKEAFEACARRETLEECGLEIGSIRFQFVANAVGYGLVHYVHIGLITEWKAGEPKNLEPTKCEGWDWYSLDALPEPLFVYTKWSIEAHQTGLNYFDSEARPAK